jgi:hypothetical protein
MTPSPRKDDTGLNGETLLPLTPVRGPVPRLDDVEDRVARVDVEAGGGEEGGAVVAGEESL